MRRQIKDTLLFLGFFLLAGFLHSNDPDPNYFLISAICCAEYLIYAGLILFWAQSVRQRLLPTRAKGYLLAAACLMLLFIAAQFTKYRVSVTPGMARYCWYVYYLPIILIPTLFLMTCFSLVRGGGPRETGRAFSAAPFRAACTGCFDQRSAHESISACRRNSAHSGIPPERGNQRADWLFGDLYARAGFCITPPVAGPALLWLRGFSS